MIKNNQWNFDSIQLMKHFYDPSYEFDKDVREAWYIYCFYFLPKVNKGWKDCLQTSRLRKKTCLFNHVTTSDEAIVQWFLELWVPKIAEEQKNNWPVQKKSFGEGEHEIKARQKEYVLIHNRVHYGRQREGKEVAFKWDDVFWQEAVVKNPNAFAEESIEKSKGNTLIYEQVQEEEACIPLPGLDNNDDLLQVLLNKQRSQELTNSSDKLLDSVGDEFIYNYKENHSIIERSTTVQNSTDDNGNNFVSMPEVTINSIDSNSEDKPIFQV
jgi:hypothetical protein